MIQIWYIQYISDIENISLININQFWKYIHALNKTKNIVPDCVKYNNLSSSNIFLKLISCLQIIFPVFMSMIQQTLMGMFHYPLLYQLIIVLT